MAAAKDSKNAGSGKFETEADAAAKTEVPTIPKLQSSPTIPKLQSSPGSIHWDDGIPKMERALAAASSSSCVEASDCGAAEQSVRRDSKADFTFNDVDVPYLKLMLHTQARHSSKVDKAKINQVLRDLKKCPGLDEDDVQEALKEVSKRRKRWSKQEFPTTLDNDGPTREFNDEELECCLMISTYTDNALYKPISRLLNDSDGRLSNAEAAEAAHFWVSCIRHSAEKMAKARPGWMVKGTKVRAMKFRFPGLSQKFKKGSVKAWYTIKSTTWDAETLRDEDNPFCGYHGDRTMIEIQDCEALDISRISAFPEEKECFILPGSFFRVVDTDQKPEKMDSGDPFKTADKVVLKFLGKNIEHLVNILEFPRPAIVVVGNPGSGKSTLLNRYAESNVFDAGFAAGAGLTAELRTGLYESGGQTGLLIDTPGMADISKERREAAAAAIFLALVMSNSFKFFFVVKTDAGRIRPADIETIKRVMQACEDLGDNFCFGLIVNQCKPHLMANESDQNIIKNSFERCLGVQNILIHFAAEEDALLNANAAAPLGQDTRDFMDMKVPVTCKHTEQIKKVNFGTYKLVADKVRKLEDQVRDEAKEKARTKNRIMRLLYGGALLFATFGAISYRLHSHNCQMKAELTAKGTELAEATIASQKLMDSWDESIAQQLSQRNDQLQTAENKAALCEQDIIRLRQKSPRTSTNENGCEETELQKREAEDALYETRRELEKEKQTSADRLEEQKRQQKKAEVCREEKHAVGVEKERLDDTIKETLQQQNRVNADLSTARHELEEEKRRSEEEKRRSANIFKEKEQQRMRVHADLSDTQGKLRNVTHELSKERERLADVLEEKEREQKKAEDELRDAKDELKQEKAKWAEILKERERQKKSAEDGLRDAQGESERLAKAEDEARSALKKEREDKLLSDQIHHQAMELQKSVAAQAKIQADVQARIRPVT